MTRLHSFATFALLVTLAAPWAAAQTAPATRPAATVRVAALAGLNDFDFWPEVAKRFEAQTGIHVDTVVTGNKDAVGDLFKQGGIDLITMQSPDAVLDLVAQGYATDLRPWVQTDLALVGPSEDPAHIKGTADAAAAIKKIIAAKAPFVVHGNLGADQVVKSILLAGKGQIDPDSFTLLLDDHQKHVLQAAIDRKAYTLISRVAFASGKLPAAGYEIMVRGDPRLLRSYVAAIANPGRLAGAHEFEVRKLMQFLLGDDTQDWIRTFGKGKLGDGSLFHAVMPERSPAPDGAVLRIDGDVPRPLALTADALSKLTRHEIHVKDHKGVEATYSGFLLRDVLLLTGAPVSPEGMRGPNTSMYVTVEAADGYKATFALAELDDGFAPRSILLADRRDDAPLAAGEGPFRIVAPQEAKQARWVRRVTILRVSRG